MVSVGVPVGVAEFFGRFTGDDKVARGVLVKTADDVEHRGFAAPGRTENGDKFMLAEVNGDPAQRIDGRIADGVGFSDFV